VYFPVAAGSHLKKIERNRDPEADYLCKVLFRLDFEGIVDKIPYHLRFDPHTESETQTRFSWLLLSIALGISCCNA